jgi:CheY-like chemotaxis protein
VTILIAEDEATSRWALMALLREEGYRAIAVTTGRDALAACDAVRPDVVILDYGLPDMSGLDVLTAIAPAGARRPVALIVTGQHLGARARRAARDLGVRIFRKPISPPDLLDSVRGVAATLREREGGAYTRQP